MPVWKKPALTQLQDELTPLREREAGQLIYYGDYYDVDTEELFHGPESGLIVADLAPASDPPVLLLPLDGSPILWPVAPFGAYKFEWLPQTAATQAARLPRDAWPVDLQQYQGPASLGEQPRRLPSKTEIRSQFIDPVLEKVGWRKTAIEREKTFYHDKEKKLKAFGADYVLYVDHPRRGRVTAAIIDATRDTFPAGYSLEHGKICADVAGQNVRFVFATNGREFVQYDRTTRTTGSPQPIKMFPRLDAIREMVRRIPESEWRIDKDDFAWHAEIRQEKLNGDDAQVVRRVAERLIPDSAERRASFDYFTESLLLANEHGPGKWETTLNPTGDFIRLNVGRLEVMSIFRNLLHVILDADKLTKEQFYAIGQYAVLSHIGVYKTVKTSIACDFRPEVLPQVKPLIEEAHRSLLDLASATAKPNAGFKPNQAAGVIDYLKTLTNRKVPHPIYS
jgi:hypothetical protein